MNIKQSLIFLICFLSYTCTSFSMPFPLFSDENGNTIYTLTINTPDGKDINIKHFEIQTTQTSENCKSGLTKQLEIDTYCTNPSGLCFKVFPLTYQLTSEKLKHNFGNDVHCMRLIFIPSDENISQETIDIQKLQCKPGGKENCIYDPAKPMTDSITFKYLDN